MAAQLTGVLANVGAAPVRYVRSEWAGWRDDVADHPRLFAGLAAVAALQSADSSTLGATARLLRRDLSLTHGQIGLLSSIAAVVGLVATIPAGMVADRWSRVRLLRIAVVLWAVGMAWTALASSFVSMLLPRALLGSVNAAAGPVTASLIGDTVPVERRGRVYGRLLAAQLIGSGLGVFVSGELAGALGWRWGYWWLGGAAVATFVLLARIPEPERRRARTRKGEADVNRLPWWRAVRRILSIRTNVALIIASACGYYFLGGIATFGFSYLHARFGISQAVAPLVLVTLGVGAVVGALVGARFGDRLMRAGHPAGRIAAVLIALSGAVVCIVPALAVPRFAIAFPLLIAGSGLLGAVNPPLDAARIDIVPQPLLGRAESVRSVLRGAADASAPAVVGRVAGVVGLPASFLLMTPFLGLAVGLGLIALHTYPADAAAAAETRPDENAHPG